MKKPQIDASRIVARSRLFGVEELQLTFSNGEKRTYERLITPPIPAVMVVPLLDDDTVVMIREYSAGVDDYALTLPKGALDPGEGLLEAANRELQEEAGYAARRMHVLKSLTLAPGYMGHHIKVVLAEDLYPSRLPGDEPEPLEVVQYPLSAIDDLLLRDDFHEARAIAALFMVKRLLDSRRG